MNNEKGINLNKIYKWHKDVKNKSVGRRILNLVELVSKPHK
jgi:hypothetical protein